MKFFKALLLLILAALLQFSVGGLVSLWFSFIFATLVALAFFLDFAELVFFTLLGVFFLNWQPALSWEAVLIAVLSLAVFWLRRFSPWQVWLSVLVAVPACFLVFYVAVGAGLILRAPVSFLTDLFLALAFSSVGVQVLEERT